MSERPLPPKRKYRWGIQLFKDGTPQTPVLDAVVSHVPAAPWFGDEPWKWDHEIHIDTSNYLEFDGTVPHITRRSGSGKVVEEWDLLEVKLNAAAECDGQYGYFLVYKDTEYVSHICKKCHGAGGYMLRGSVWESEMWEVCDKCHGEFA